MIIPYEKELTPAHLQEITEIAHEFGVTIRPIRGEGRTIYAIIGDERPDLLIKRLEGLSYIDHVDRIQKPYKLLAKESRHATTPFTINGKTVGQDFMVFAGPCTIDYKNPNLFLETAHSVKEAGADMLRGGVWKPRTSPYSFQGDAKSLDILLQARDKYGLKVVTEVMELEQVKACVDAKVDCFQVGARNALNYRLLSQIGELTAGTNTMVLLKRSIHMGNIDEFILAAEYIAGHGNSNIMLCPRGTLPAVDGYRNNPDECITQILQERTWVPVIVDPSHSVGKAKYVPRAAMAAAAYGANGVIIETHCAPVKGLGDDPKQAITPAVLKNLIADLKQVSSLTQKYAIHIDS
jgi:3-deoxy-7-phosphoheptulonate synthase